VKSRARRGALAGCALAVALAGACGDEPLIAADLFLWASWNGDPASSAEIGYEVDVEIRMNDRAATCAPLPDVRITVNDVEHTRVVGDCDTTIRQLVQPVAADADTVVTVRSGDARVGEATYRALFPGFGATQPLSPADGRVRAGETLALALPPGWPVDVDVDVGRVDAVFYWLDPAPSVPPFHSSAVATANAERTAVEVIAPTVTGRAQVILRNHAYAERVGAASCAGFSRCAALPASDVLGPVAVEVIP
jgi:hypothetical protein